MAIDLSDLMKQCLDYDPKKTFLEIREILELRDKFKGLPDTERTPAYLMEIAALKFSSAVLNSYTHTFIAQIREMFNALPNGERTAKNLLELTSQLSWVKAAQHSPWAALCYAGCMFNELPNGERTAKNLLKLTAQPFWEAAASVVLMADDKEIKVADEEIKLMVSYLSEAEQNKYLADLAKKEGSPGQVKKPARTGQHQGAAPAP